MRCLIVDDNANFLDAARTILERDGIDVVGVASSCAEALRRMEELHPDVMLVDVDLGAECGFDLADQVHDTSTAGLAAPSVILISAHSEQDLAEMLAASPAVGFVPKLALSSGAIRQLVGAGR